MAAIVDWELTTIGDPLLDLGHLLSSWPRPGREAITPVAQAHRAARPPTRSSPATTPRSTATCRTCTWYRVLACYRLGIILEGSHARAFSGLTPLEIGDRLHDHTLQLFAQAAELIDRA